MEKLNKRGVGKDKGDDAQGSPKPAASQAPEGALTVEVDIQQSLVDIVIVTPIPGADLDDVRISIEREGDVLIIQGDRKKPEILTAKGEGSMKAGETTMWIQHENKWGPFYRKVILPVQIDPGRTQAVLSKGVLTLTLPLKKSVPQDGTGIRIPVAGKE